MTHRTVATFGIPALVFAFGSLSLLMSQAPQTAHKAAAEPQNKAATPPAAPSTAPAAKPSGFRTPWGDPDLQGVWNDATSTPLQRPTGVASKDVLRGEEAEEFQDQLANNLSRDRRDGGADVDVNRAYNEHWMDSRRLKVTTDHRTSLIVDPPDGRIPPLVPISAERQKESDKRAAALGRFNAGMPNTYFDFELPIRCVVRIDMPPYMPTIYNNDLQIVQSPGYVVIAPEMIHSARIIPLDGRPHIGKNLREWLGDTRGHWDGNTLVLETTNFRPDTDIMMDNGDAVAFGDVFPVVDPATFRLTERLTRVDARTLNYEYTVEDPHTWTRAWTARIPWTRIDPAEQMYEYACHEDNYDVSHFLIGAREREKRGEVAHPIQHLP
jgi:hypothetical protein